MAALSLAGVHSVWAIMAPMVRFAISHRVNQPCGQTGAVGTFYPLTLGVGFFGVALATVAWTLVQRDGDPSARPGALPAQA